MWWEKESGIVGSAKVAQMAGTLTKCRQFMPSGKKYNTLKVSLQGKAH